MSIKVIGFDLQNNARSAKILVAAKLAGVDASESLIKIGSGENTTEAYTGNCHPIGRAPVIETQQGYVFETNACLRHIARSGSKGDLYGRTTADAAQVDMWLDYCLTELDKAGVLYLHAGAFNRPHPEEECKKVYGEFEEALQGMNRWLEIRTFLATERMTIADIAAAFTLDWTFRYCPNHEIYTKKYKNVYRLYKTVMNNPTVVEVLRGCNYDIGLPKPDKKAEKPAEKKVEKKSISVSTTFTGAEIATNFEKYARVAKLQKVTPVWIELTTKKIQEAHDAETVKAMFENTDKNEPIIEKYVAMSQCSEKDTDKIKTELNSLLEKFAEDSCKPPQIQVKKVQHPEATMKLLEDFEKYASTQELKFTTFENIKATLEVVSGYYAPGEINVMLTDGDDCDEFLEKYASTANYSAKDGGLKMRNELIRIVEGFAESRAE